MRAIFVAGTDTGVGKTIITGCLAKYFKELGFNIVTQKWIQTGCKSSFSQDIKLHLKIMNCNASGIEQYIPFISPYTFKHASSAHLSSRIENKRININKIIKSFRFLTKVFDFVIVEGLGGVLVPISRKHLAIDMVKRLDLAVLLVAENRLGAINHTLLTIEALNSRKIKILGLVFNNLKKDNKLILEDNPRIIRAFSKQRVFGILSREPTYKKIYERFVPIGNRIFKLIRNG
jgi:dethiobiotin synthetase